VTCCNRSAHSSGHSSYGMTSLSLPELCFASIQLQLGIVM